MRMRRRLRPTGNEPWRRQLLLGRIMSKDLELDLLAGLGPVGRLYHKGGHRTADRKD